MKASLDLPEQHAAVLTFLVDTIHPTETLWVLTGSAGLRLQGVDLPVYDLDLQTDAETIFLLEKKLAGYMKVPVHLWESEHILSHHGQAEINRVQVEFLGDMRHRASDGTWEPSLNIESIFMWVECRGLEIPVFPLAHEALAYEKMGRAQKAELIRSAIRKETL
jgi:aminoglycoside-2''-adenylyltransferase